MMEKQYQPELGQAIFGQPHQAFEGSDLLEAALRSIGDEICRVMWNERQEEFDNPFFNTGNRYESPVFSVHAYSWSDDEQPWNFKWRDLRVSWYKHVGRGLSANMDVTPQLISEMLNECLVDLRKRDALDGNPASIAKHLAEREGR